MNKLLIAIFSVSLIINGYSQELKRKGNWGILYHLPSDTIDVEKGLKGLVVDEVLKNSTGDNSGIKKGDVIMQINEIQTNSKADYIKVINNYREGASITCIVLRLGKSKKLKGIVIEKVREQYDNADVLYETVPFANGFLRSIIIKPKTKKKVPMLFFIQGYTCSSIDNMGKDNPYQKILEELVNRGYAICKVEKPGMGDCQGTGECDEIDYHTEQAAFQAAYDNLENYDFIDKNNVFVFGHSMGGIIAPMLNQDKVKANGIVVYGTGIKSWLEYFIEMNRQQFIFSGADYVENDMDFHRRLPFVYEFMVLKKSPQELAKDTAMKRILYEDWHWDGENKIESRSYKYWQQLQEPGQIEAWKNTESNVLSIWGAGDFVAFSEEEHKMIVDIVNYYHPGKASYYQMPNSDHAFTRVDDRYHSAKNWGNWEYMKANFNDAIIEKLDSWMQMKIANE
jgi:uncharacterized protein